MHTIQKLVRCNFIVNKLVCRILYLHKLSYRSITYGNLITRFCFSVIFCIEIKKSQFTEIGF